MASPTRFDDPNADATFIADINKKMRVPHKISMGDVVPNGHLQDISNGHHTMHVPERILVAGADSHIGTRAPPREMLLDNSMLPESMEEIRVNTPPRVITLDKYPFPMVDNDEPIDKTLDIKIRKTENNRLQKETEGIVSSEELIHLRRQVVKLNRRLMAVELDVANQQQRDKLLFGFGLAYFLLKAILWLNRS